MSIEIIKAGNARETKTGVARGVDVDVTVSVDGETIDGEVTLVPAQYDGRLEAYGPSADHWVSGKLLAHLERLSPEGLREALDEIESAARDAAKS